jgi:hypothetical protein
MIAAARSTRMQSNQLDLSRYHGKRVAIVMGSSPRSAILSGRACFLDDNEGPRLRISVDDEPHQSNGNPAFEFAADTLNGLIRRDDRFGGDYQIHLYRLLPTFAASTGF